MPKISQGMARRKEGRRSSPSLSLTVKKAQREREREREEATNPSIIYKAGPKSTGRLTREGRRDEISFQV